MKIVVSKTFQEEADSRFGNALRGDFPEPIEQFVGRLSKMWDLEDAISIYNDLRKDVLDPMGGHPIGQAMGVIQAQGMPQPGQQSKMAQVGEVHRWKDGKLYEKTDNGWIPYDHDSDTLSHEEWGGHSNLQFHVNDVQDSGAGKDLASMLAGDTPDFAEGMEGVGQRIDYIVGAFDDYGKIAPNSESEMVKQKKKTLIQKILDYIKSLIKAILGDKIEEGPDGSMNVREPLNQVDARNMGAMAPQLNQFLDQNIKNIQKDTAQMVKKHSKEAMDQAESNEMGDVQPWESNKRKEDFDYEGAPNRVRESFRKAADTISQIAQSGPREPDFMDVLHQGMSAVNNEFKNMDGWHDANDIERIMSGAVKTFKMLVHSVQGNDEEGVAEAQERLGMIGQKMERLADIGDWRAENDFPDRYYHADKAAGESFDKVSQYTADKFGIDGNNLFQSGLDGGVLHGFRDPEKFADFHAKMSLAGKSLEDTFKDMDDNDEKTISSLMDAARHMYKTDDMLEESGANNAVHLAEMAQMATLGVARDLASGAMSRAEAHDMIGHISNIVNGMRDAEGDKTYQKMLESGENLEPPQADSLDAFQEGLLNFKKENEKAKAADIKDQEKQDQKDIEAADQNRAEAMQAEAQAQQEPEQGAAQAPESAPAPQAAESEPEAQMPPPPEDMPQEFVDGTWEGSGLPHPPDFGEGKNESNNRSA